MKRWIVAASATVAAVLIGVFAIPNAMGSTYASWNRTATTGATVAAGTWASTTAPIAPDPTTQTQVTDVAWRAESAFQFCADVTVTTTSTTPIAWQLRVDTTQGPYWGITNLSFDGTGLVVSGPDANGIITVKGSANNAQIAAGSSPLKVIICHYNDGRLPAVQAPGSSTYTVSNVMQQDGVRMCVVSTVTGKEARFFVPYAITFDWNALLATTFGSGSATYAAFVNKPVTSASSNDGNYPFSRSGDVWTVKGDGWATAGIKAPSVATVRSCTAY